ncbi:putative osmoprotectant ABC transporter, partial [Streptococcus mutans NLML8]
GSIPTAFMAIVSDLILGIIQRYLEPKGISTNQ